MCQLSIPLLTAAMAFSSLHATPALANDFSVSLESRYIDKTFNDVFSNSPSVYVDGTLDLTPRLYVTAYARSGFQRPFQDSSSEAGVGFGYQHDVGRNTTFTAEVGRYANYGGRGLGAGDWYASIIVQRGRVNASASVLRGETNSVLLSVAYDLPVGHRFTVRPSTVYFTANRRVNPGLEATYALTGHAAISARFVAPRYDTRQGRGFYGAIALTCSF